MDEEFTITAYPNVQENLKLPTEDQVVLEEPASSTGTLSSLQNLDKELSFTNQFLVEKTQEYEPEKTNTKSEVQSMVTVPIHQDTSSVPPMTTPAIDLTVSHPVSTMIHAPLPTSTATVSKAVDEIVTDAVDWAMQAPLRARFSDLPAVDMKEILQQRMFEDKFYEAHEDYKNLFDALQKSLECDYSNQLLADLNEARGKKIKRRESLRTPPGSPPSQPPPPPPPADASGAPDTSRASGSSQLPPPPPPLSTSTYGSAQQQGNKALSLSKTSASAPQSMAWTISDSRYDSAGVFGAQELSPADSLMHDDSIPDEQWKPLPAEERLATLEPVWTIPSSNMSDVANNWASVLVLTYEIPAENSFLAKTGDMTTFMN
ncbi:hypothetical protein Tco_1022976 [Tanacetum coccineum]